MAPAVHHFGGEGKKSRLSAEYIVKPRAICLVLFKQAAPRLRSLALFKAGRSIAARIAIMAITTSNSIRVKADDWRAGLAPGPGNCDVRSAHRIILAFFTWRLLCDSSHIRCKWHSWPNADDETYLAIQHQITK